MQFIYRAATGYYGPMVQYVQFSQVAHDKTFKTDLNEKSIIGR